MEEENRRKDLSIMRSFLFTSVVRAQAHRDAMAQMETKVTFLAVWSHPLDASLNFILKLSGSLHFFLISMCKNGGQSHGKRQA